MNLSKYLKSILLCFTALFSSSVAAAFDNYILSTGTEFISGTFDPAPLEYGLGDLISKAGELYGPDVAAHLQANLEPAGSVTVVELDQPNSRAGRSDGDTIAINTRDANSGGVKLTLAQAAATLVHEMDHVDNRTNPDGTRERKDPTTNDPACGACNHMNMHLMRGSEMLTICENSDEGSTPKKSEVCEVLDLERKGAEGSASACLASACPSKIPSLNNWVDQAFNAGLCCN
jgi:hypothetical protein